jgi:hypothetical protein
MGVQGKEQEWVKAVRCRLVRGERCKLVRSGGVMVRWQVAGGGETGQDEMKCGLEPHSRWPWQQMGNALDRGQGSLVHFPLPC